MSTLLPNELLELPIHYIGVRDLFYMDKYWYTFDIICSQRFIKRVVVSVYAYP